MARKLIDLLTPICVENAEKEIEHVGVFKELLGDEWPECDVTDSMLNDYRDALYGDETWTELEHSAWLDKRNAVTKTDLVVRVDDWLRCCRRDDLANTHTEDMVTWELCKAGLDPESVKYSLDSESVKYFLERMISQVIIDCVIRGIPFAAITSINQASEKEDHLTFHWHYKINVKKFLL